MTPPAQHRSVEFSHNNLVPSEESGSTVGEMQNCHSSLKSPRIIKEFSQLIRHNTSGGGVTRGVERRGETSSVPHQLNPCCTVVHVLHLN